MEKIAVNRLSLWGLMKCLHQCLTLIDLLERCMLNRVLYSSWPSLPTETPSHETYFGICRTTLTLSCQEIYLTSVDWTCCTFDFFL